MSRALAVVVLLSILLAGVAAVTSPIAPAAYRPAPGPPLVGPLAPNDELRRVERLGEGRLQGPEDVAVDGAGRLYAGVETAAAGAIRRLTPTADGDWAVEIFAATRGRPLGLDFDATGRLWVAASGAGLVAIDSEGHAISAVEEAGGVAVGFADDVATAPDGRVYFSDASTRYGPGELLRDTLEARPHGRLVEYDPTAGVARVALEGLYFANGVAVAPAGDFVLVAETFRYRIRRLWLRGPKRGRAEVFADNLPGFPDGVSARPSGGYWVALFALRSEVLDRWLHPRPWLKRILGHLPERKSSGAEPYGLVLELDAEGRVLRSLHDPGGRRFPAVTSVEESGDVLYLGSIASRAIGRLRLQ